MELVLADDGGQQLLPLGVDVGDRSELERPFGPGVSTAQTSASRGVSSRTRRRSIICGSVEVLSSSPVLAKTDWANSANFISVTSSKAETV